MWVPSWRRPETQGRYNQTPLCPPAPHSPEKPALDTDTPDPCTHRARTFTNLLGLSPSQTSRAWVPKPPLQGQFCRFIKYPTAHAQTPAQPVQPGAHKDLLPLRYPSPVVQIRSTELQASSFMLLLKLELTEEGDESPVCTISCSTNLLTDSKAVKNYLTLRKCCTVCPILIFLLLQQITLQFPAVQC